MRTLFSIVLLLLCSVSVIHANAFLNNKHWRILLNSSTTVVAGEATTLTALLAPCYHKSDYIYTVYYMWSFGAAVLAEGEDEIEHTSTLDVEHTFFLPPGSTNSTRLVTVAGCFNAALTPDDQSWCYGLVVSGVFLIDVVDGTAPKTAQLASSRAATSFPPIHTADNSHLNAFELESVDHELSRRVGPVQGHKNAFCSGASIPLGWPALALALVLVLPLL